MEDELQGLECRQEAIWNLQCCVVDGKTVTRMGDSDSEKKCKRENQQQDVMNHCLWEIREGVMRTQDLGLCHRMMILVPFTKTGTLTEKGLGRKPNSVLDKWSLYDICLEIISKLLELDKGLGQKKIEIYKLFHIDRNGEEMRQKRTA